MARSLVPQKKLSALLYAILLSFANLLSTAFEPDLLTDHNGTTKYQTGFSSHDTNAFHVSAPNLPLCFLTHQMKYPTLSNLWYQPSPISKVIKLQNDFG